MPAIFFLVSLLKQADLEKYGTLLAPPPPGQSKFDQVLEWAEKQQGK